MTVRSADVAGSSGALTAAQLYILLTLAEGRCHGYGIMQEVERRTDGAVVLGPGTLYRSIKQLLEQGLITEVEGDPEAKKPRRSYALTRAGKTRTAEEARRLQSLAGWARAVMALEGGRQ